MRKRDLEAAYEALNEKYAAALARQLDLEQELAVGPPKIFAEPLLFNLRRLVNEYGHAGVLDAMAYLKRRPSTAKMAHDLAQYH